MKPRELAVYLRVDGLDECEVGTMHITGEDNDAAILIAGVMRAVADELRDLTASGSLNALSTGAIVLDGEGRYWQQVERGRWRQVVDGSGCVYSTHELERLTGDTWVREWEPRQ